MAQHSSWLNGQRQPHCFAVLTWSMWCCSWFVVPLSVVAQTPDDLQSPDVAAVETNVVTSNAVEGVTDDRSYLPQELQDLPPIPLPVPTATVESIEDPQLPRSTSAPTNVFKKWWSSWFGKDADPDRMTSEPTISVQVVNAPTILADNLKAYLQRITVAELHDFRDNLPRIRAQAKEAAQAVGYYNAQFRFSPVSEGVLRVNVVAGDPILFHDVRVKIEGDEQAASVFETVIQQDDLKKGDILNHNRYEQLKSKILNLASEKGYFDGDWATHDVLVTLPDNTADVTLIYQTGSRYRFGALTFANTDADQGLPVRLSLLKQLVPFAEQDWYDAAQVAQLSRNLLDTRWFNNISVEAVTPEPLANEQLVSPDVAIAAAENVDEKDVQTALPIVMGKRQVSQTASLADDLKQQNSQQVLARQTKEIPVDINVNSRRPNSAEVGVGYGTDTGARVRTQYRRALINDQGHSFDANMEISKIRQAFDTRYTLPYKHPLNDTLSYIGGYERELRQQSENNLDLQTQALTFGAERAIRPKNGDWQHTISLRYRVDQLENELGGAMDAANLPAPFNVAGASFTQQALLLGYGVNKVSSRGGLDPVEGFRQYYQIEAGSKNVLTDADLIILRAGWRGIYSMGEQHQHQWVGRSDLASILTNDFVDVPYNLRFFAGGDQSIRGYDYKSLSTTQNGFLIGGQNLAVASMEYNYRFLPNWRGAVFVDAGNAFDEKFNDPIKVGAGLGIRWSSPVGPIRVDVAAGVSETSVPIRLHFFIGPPL